MVRRLLQLPIEGWGISQSGFSKDTNWGESINKEVNDHSRRGESQKIQSAGVMVKTWAKLFNKTCFLRSIQTKSHSTCLLDCTINLAWPCVQNNQGLWKRNLSRLIWWYSMYQLISQLAKQPSSKCKTSYVLHVSIKFTCTLLLLSFAIELVTDHTHDHLVGYINYGGCDKQLRRACQWIVDARHCSGSLSQWTWHTPGIKL